MCEEKIRFCFENLKYISEQVVRINPTNLTSQLEAVGFFLHKTPWQALFALPHRPLQ
jgi:hypothetical protein